MSDSEADSDEYASAEELEMEASVATPAATKSQPDTADTGTEVMEKTSESDTGTGSSVEKEEESPKVEAAAPQEEADGSASKTDEPPTDDVHDDAEAVDAAATAVEPEDSTEPLVEESERPPSPSDATDVGKPEATTEPSVDEGAAAEGKTEAKPVEPVVAAKEPAAAPASQPATSSGGGGGSWGSWSSWGASLASVIAPEPVQPAAEPERQHAAADDVSVAVSAADDVSAAASAAAASAASAAAGFFSMLGGGAEPASQQPTGTAAGEAKAVEAEQSAPPAAGTESGAAAGTGLFDMFGGFSGISATLQEKGEALMAGSLDTLELIGKKTVQVLTEDDPGFRSTRERIRSGRPKAPNLSEMLNEAKAQADVVKTQAEDSRGAGPHEVAAPREKGYNDFFEEYHGMIHLEALELLSRQSSGMVSGMLSGAEPAISRTARKYADVFETTRKEADSTEECDETTLFDSGKFQEAVQKCIDEFAVGLSLASVKKTAEECERRCEELQDGELELSAIQESAVRTLALLTAFSIEVFHKSAELMLLPASETDGDAEAFANAKCEACFRFSSEVCRQGEYLVNCFVAALNACQVEDKDKISAAVTTLFIESSNSVGYTRDGCDFMLSSIQVLYMTRALA